jgi:HAD superfamily hydrolase (TIGR01509 family)
MQRITKLILCVFIATVQNLYCHDTPIDAHKKITTIIFDLDDVLFQHNKTAFAHKIGIGKVTKYTLLNWTTPDTTCLNALDAISAQEPNQPAIPLIHRDKKMPCCIVDWQLGNKSQVQARAQLHTQIEQLGAKKYFKNVKEKDLIQRILDISMDPHYLNDIVKPATAMIELAKELKARNYRLIILSNLAQEQYELLHKHHPNITRLFDDIIVSSQIKLLKPSVQMYEHLLDKHKLQADECVCVEAQKESVQAAQQKGITGIVHKNARTTRAALEKLGV